MRSRIAITDMNAEPVYRLLPNSIGFLSADWARALENGNIESLGNVIDPLVAREGVASGKIEQDHLRR
jgi:hypothetical protein